MLLANSKWLRRVWLCFLISGPVMASGPADVAALEEQGIFVGAPLPDWVEPQKIEAGQPPLQGHASQYLLVDSQLNLGGEESLYYRNAAKILTPSGLDEWSELPVRYSPEYEQALIHSVDVIRDGKRINQLDKAHIRVLQQEEEMGSSLFHGANTVLLILDDLRVGDQVSYEVTIRGSNPIFAGKSGSAFALNWSVPVAKRSVRVIADKEGALKSRFHNSDSRFERKRTAHGDEYSLTLRDVEAVEEESHLPSSYSPYAWVSVSEYSSWAEVNDWALSLYSPAYDGKGISDIARDIRARSQDEKDYIRNALLFVQDEVRYLGLEMGENSHRPHAPDVVLRRRYGDCKDKTVLFISLLAAQGIEAWPALVSSSDQDAIIEDIPGPGSFDHVITYLTVDGKPYWFDPTNHYQGGTLETLSQPDYGFALIVRKGTRGLTDMFESGAEPARITIEESFRAEDFSGSVVYQVITKYEGQEADYQRYRFDNTPISDISDLYLAFYREYYEAVTELEPVQVHDDRANNIVTVTETYRIDDFWFHEEGYMSMNVNALIYGDYVSEPDDIRRSSPYYQGERIRVSSTMKYHFPEDVDLSFPEPEGGVEHPAIKFHFRDSYAGKTYTYKSSMEIRKSVIQHEGMKEYADAVDSIMENWGFSISFMNPDAVPGYRKAIALKRRLEELAQ